MKWSKDVPTKAGWYWWRDESHGKRIVAVVGCSILTVFDYPQDLAIRGPMPPTRLGGYWSGPIPEPEEA